MSRTVFLTFILFPLLFSCASGRRISDQNRSVALIADKQSTTAANNSAVARKVITNANLLLETDKPETVPPKIIEIAKKYEGYFTRVSNDRAVIRIRNEQMDNAIADISVLGKVKEKTISGNDVTDQFYDQQIRLENTEKSRQRYLELLKKAESVEDILKIEKELERLNETIDLLKGQINRLEHLSDFSTITVTIRERKKPGIFGYVFVGLYKSVRWLFVRN